VKMPGLMHQRVVLGHQGVALILRPKKSSSSLKVAPALLCDIFLPMGAKIFLPPGGGGIKGGGLFLISNFLPLTSQKGNPPILIFPDGGGKKEARGREV